MNVKIPKSHFDLIEGMVVRLFQRAGIRELPLDYMALCDCLGIPLLKKSQASPSLLTALEELHDDSEPRLSAFYAKDPRLPHGVIYYDDSEPETRNRFSVTHEAGHEELRHEGGELAEQEANFFAGCAVAHPVLIHQLSQIGVGAIASAFGIGRDCAEKRLARYERWLEWSGKEYTATEKELLRQIRRIGGQDVVIKPR